MAKFVYADNAATTPVSREVVEAMSACFTEAWGNPSSQHGKGYEAKALVDDARARIAKVFNCNPSELYFTASGTESDNWAIKGAAMRMKKKGRTHIVTSKIEHHAVLHTCESLEKQGFTVTYVGVDEYGVVDLDELRSVVTENTALVAIMFANNEIGTIEPVEEIAEIAHAKGALFFTDAFSRYAEAQAAGSHISFLTQGMFSSDSMGLFPTVQFYLFLFIHTVVSKKLKIFYYYIIHYIYTSRLIYHNTYRYSTQRY